MSGIIFSFSCHYRHLPHLSFRWSLPYRLWYFLLYVWSLFGTSHLRGGGVALLYVASPGSWVSCICHLGFPHFIYLSCSWDILARIIVGSGHPFLSCSTSGRQLWGGFLLLNGGVKGVVDIYPSFQYINLPSTDSCSFFNRTTLHSRIVSMISCRRLIQVTSPIFNFRYFDSACKMPSRIFFSSLSYFVFGGGLRVHVPAFPIGRRSLNVGHFP